MPPIGNAIGQALVSPLLLDRMVKKKNRGDPRYALMRRAAAHLGTDSYDRFCGHIGSRR